MMLKSRYCAYLLLSLSLLNSSTLRAEDLAGNDPHEKNIKETIGFYFKGRRNADIDLLKKAFSTEARLITANTNQSIKVITLQEYFSVVRQKGKVSVDTYIQEISIENNIAFAKVRFDYEKISYIDFLILMKVKGRWKIVSKTFSSIH